MNLHIIVTKIPDTREPQAYQRTYHTHSIDFHDPDGRIRYLTDEHKIAIARTIVARDIDDVPRKFGDSHVKTAQVEKDGSVTIVVEDAYLD